MPLITDHRPRTFKGFLGSEGVIHSIQKKIKNGEYPNATLIVGMSGVGKTTLSRIIARKIGALTAKNPDKDFNYQELDAAKVKSKGAETINEIRSQMHLSPVGKAKRRLWLIDECHTLTGDQQDRLLKALEEPPAHSYFILATTEPEKLKVALKRRCTRFALSPVDEEEMLPWLESILTKENKTLPMKILEMIIDEAEGSPGICLGILDTVIDLPKNSMEEAIKRNTESSTVSIEICRALFKRTPWNKFLPLIQNLNAQELETIRRGIMRYCCNILLKKDEPQAFIVMDLFKNPFYDLPLERFVLACYECLDEGE